MEQETTYRERLLPSWWVWLAAFTLVGMVGIAYGAALGRGIGAVVGVLGLALACWLLWITSPVVALEGHDLAVAGARLPVSSIAGTRTVDRAGVAELRGPGSDARIFVALRPWSARDAVLVTLDDDLDPHPAWLVSSRHPVRLQDALAATMDH